MCRRDCLLESQIESKNKGTLFAVAAGIKDIRRGFGETTVLEYA